MYRERSSIGFKCSSKMSRAPSTISGWLLATNFVSSFKVFMKEWPRRSRVILTSPSVFVLLSFCFAQFLSPNPEKPSVLHSPPATSYEANLWRNYKIKLSDSQQGSIVTISYCNISSNWLQSKLHALWLSSHREYCLCAFTKWWQRTWILIW